nr:CAP domain-containing protein [Streptomyces fodineus]
MSELVSGGNMPLPGGVLRLRVAGAFDVSALVTGADGTVGSDADFVFYNQPQAPGVRLVGDVLTVDPARLRGGACRVTVVVSAAEPGTPLGRLPAPRLEVTDGSGRTVARFTPPRPGPETVLLLAELYLRPGTGWKLRAVGQGYADGLAGLARDFGVEVTDDGGQAAATAGTPDHSAPHAHTARPTATTPRAPSSRRTATTPWAPSTPPAATTPRDSSAHPTTTTPSTPTSRPTTTTPSDPLARPTAITPRTPTTRPTTTTPNETSAHPTTTTPSTPFARPTTTTSRDPSTRPAATTPGAPNSRPTTATPSAPAAQPTMTTPSNPLAHPTTATPRTAATRPTTATPRTPATRPTTTPRPPSARPTAIGSNTPAGRGTELPGDDFLRLVNSARARAGSVAVGLDPRLVSAARSHARAMADAGRLGGEGRDGVSVHQRISAAGYAYITVGEHLVSGPRSAAEFVEYCLESARTRRILLDPAFRHAALAHADAGDRYWTALWAAPLTPNALSRTAAEVVALTNAERGRAGLPPLAVDPLLTAAAQAHCADMVARDFYDHTSPDGSQPWDRAAAAGSRRRTIGENIACGQRSPAEVVDGWMNSPGHRANILKRDFGYIGVGFSGGGRAGTYWTQLFGG